MNKKLIHLQHASVSGLLALVFLLAGFDISSAQSPGVNPVADRFDFDGDHKSDISIYRPTSGKWWVKRSSAGLIIAKWGTSTDLIAPADYTGDGKSDMTVFRPSTGEWYFLRSEDFTYFGFPFGLSGDTPVPADY